MERAPVGSSGPYTEIGVLGEGSQGVVVLAEDNKTKELVAIKKIRLSQRSFINTEREPINPQAGHDCQHIVQLHEIYWRGGHVHLVMEYVPGKTLEEHLIDSGGVFSEECARSYLQQIAMALVYLHSNACVLRDLKLGNVLLDNNKQDIKLCDFGLSKRHKVPSTFCGTIYYLSPEVVKGSRKSGGSIPQPGANLQIEPYDGKAVDVWSWGVCLYIMLFGPYPFMDPSDAKPGWEKRMLNRIEECQLEIPEYQRWGDNRKELSQGVREVLQKIFVKDPAARITLDEIIETKWFQENLPEGWTALLERYRITRDASTAPGYKSPEWIHDNCLRELKLNPPN